MRKNLGLVAVIAAVSMLGSAGAAIAGGTPAHEPGAESGAHGAGGAREARAWRHHSLNLGIATLAGMPRLTYEYLWADSGGLVLEIYGMYRPTQADANRAGLGGVVGLLLDVTGVSEASDQQNNAGIGGAFGVRWHWPRQQASSFAGVLVGGDIGEIVAEPSSIDWVIQKTVYATGHIGKRWLLRNRYNITARVGAGLIYRTVEHRYQPEDVASVLFLDDLLDRYPITIDGELSLGLTF